LVADSGAATYTLPGSEPTLFDAVLEPSSYGKKEMRGRWYRRSPIQSVSLTTQMPASVS
jgi:hypothetical protein